MVSSCEINLSSLAHDFHKQRNNSTVKHDFYKLTARFTS